MKNTILLFLFWMLTDISTTNAQNLINCWHVDSVSKVSETQGNFGGTLQLNSVFGTSLTTIGDLDNDGVVDMAVGNCYDNASGSQSGAFWVLLMNSNGTVKSEVKITKNVGGFTGNLVAWDNFGYRVAGLGDLNGDGIEDIAVSSEWRHLGGSNTGSIWICFMNSNGTVSSQLEIGEYLNGFNVNLDNDDLFGLGLGNIGDINGDGVTDIGVGAARDDDGGTNSGAVYILFMNSNGTVASNQKISRTTGGLIGLPVGTQFGVSVDSIGDLNNDGVNDIIVGASWDDDGGTDRGAFWVLFLNSNGTVSSSQKVSDTQGNFGYSLSNGDYFGHTVSSGNDVDGDGILDIVTGSFFGDDGGTNRGEGYVLFMNSNGTVREYLAISQLQGGFNTVLDNDDRFGKGVAMLGDLDGDGYIEIAISADKDDDGGTNQGAFYILHLDTIPPVLITTPDTLVCEGNPVPLSVSGALNYLWDNTSLLNDSTSANPILASNSSVLLTVVGSDTFGCASTDSVLVTYLNVPDVLPDDSSMCLGDSLSAFDTHAVSYLWNTGAQVPNILADSSGQYIVTITFQNTCSDTEMVDVLVINPIIDLGPDTIVCPGDSIILEAWPNDSIQFLWNTGDTNRLITTTTVGLFWVEVGNATCTQRDSIYISQYAIIDVLPNDTVLCKNATITAFDTSALSYVWNTGSQQPSVFVDSAGQYIVTITYLTSCENTEVINVQVKNPVANLGNDTIICPGDSFLLNAWHNDTVQINWSTGDTGSFLSISDSGLIWVIVGDSSCFSIDTISISQYDIVDILPNDTTLCEKGLISAYSPNAQSYTWNTGEVSHEILVGLSGVYTVTITYLSSCSNTEDIAVILQNPIVELGNDTTICQGETITLNTWQNDTFQINWNTGDTLNAITVSDSGLYWVQLGDSTCFSTDSINVSFFLSIQPEWDSVIVWCMDSLVVLTGNDSTTEYSWNGLVAQSYTVTDTGQIIVSVKGKCEIVTDSLTVIEGDCNCGFFVPNAFTPGDDDLNNMFKPVTLCDYPYYVLRIFDRWGTLIFETNDINEGWDGTMNGKALDGGVYTWRVDKSKTIKFWSESSIGKVVLLR